MVEGFTHLVIVLFVQPLCPRTPPVNLLLCRRPGEEDHVPQVVRGHLAVLEDGRAVVVVEPVHQDKCLYWKARSARFVQ